MACTGSGYLINGVDLSLYGFKPIAPIALSGIWDMPASETSQIVFTKLATSKWDYKSLSIA